MIGLGGGADGIILYSGECRVYRKDNRLVFHVFTLLLQLPLLLLHILITFT